MKSMLLNALQLVVSWHRHKQLQLVVMAMLKHAGIVATTEDTKLVVGNGQRRETDVMGHNVKLDNSWYMEIGADVTVVCPNLMDQRSTRFHGIAATVAEKSKRKFENTEANLRKRGMHFFPLAVEMNGALGPTMQRFIKKISLVAFEVRGHNISFSHHWWSMVLANTIHQAVAESFFMKSKAILNEQSQIGLPFHIGSGQFGSLASEGSMGERMR